MPPPIAREPWMEDVAAFALWTRGAGARLDARARRGALYTALRSPRTFVRVIVATIKHRLAWWGVVAHIIRIGWRPKSR
jgi:hypothetical protein